MEAAERVGKTSQDAVEELPDQDEELVDEVLESEDQVGEGSSERVQEAEDRAYEMLVCVGVVFPCEDETYQDQGR